MFFALLEEAGLSVKKLLHQLYMFKSPRFRSVGHVFQRFGGFCVTYGRLYRIRIAVFLLGDKLPKLTCLCSKMLSQTRWWCFTVGEIKQKANLLY